MSDDTQYFITPKLPHLAGGVDGVTTDDDPNYIPYVMWATVCFLFSALGLVRLPRRAQLACSLTRCFPVGFDVLRMLPLQGGTSSPPFPLPAARRNHVSPRAPVGPRGEKEPYVAARGRRSPRFALPPQALRACSFPRIDSCASVVHAGEPRMRPVPCDRVRMPEEGGREGMKAFRDTSCYS